MRDKVEIYGVKLANGSTSTFPIMVNVDDQIKISGQTGVARTTNPTATADGAVVNASYDKLGRQVVTPYQIRDLLFTANATLTRATETSLIAGNGTNFYDIVTITGANTSGIAQNISIRFGTAGTVIDQLTIPLTGTANKQYTVPLSASEVDQSITAQNTTQADMSDSPVSITVTGIKNI